MEPGALQLIADTIARVETKLDKALERLELRLDQKADKTELANARLELLAQNTRLSALERDKELRDARAKVHQERDQRSLFSRKNRWALIATTLTVLATVTLAIVAVVQALHF